MSPVTLLDGLDGLPQDKPWAIALSGGPDSLALLWLLLQHTSQRPLHAFIVDHGLRAEASAEAAHVATVAAALGATPHILTWHGPKPTVGIQAAARDARHALLLNATRAHGCGALLFAHHLDDQVETVALRVRKKSGPLGLAGMPLLFTRCGVRCARPLLARWRKADLLALCHAQNLPYVTDPSNSNTHYARVAMRQELAADPALWAKMQALWQHGAQDRQAHILSAQEAEVAGLYTLDMDALYARLVAPSALSSQTLQFLMTLLGQKPYFVAPEQMAALQSWLASGSGSGTGSGTALGGCRFIRTQGSVLLLREVGEIVQSATRPTAPFLWDKRFWITKAGGPVVPLADTAWRTAATPTLQDRLALLPAPVRKTLPVVQKQQGQVMAPDATTCPAFNPLCDGFIVPA